MDRHEKYNIESFIRRFKKDFSDETVAENAFSSGNCYHFAVILNDLFCGDIVYNPIQNHFAFKLKSSYDIFDITGKLNWSSSDWVTWFSYQTDEPIESHRINEQCRYKYFEE